MGTLARCFDAGDVVSRRTPLSPHPRWEGGGRDETPPHPRRRRPEERDESKRECGRAGEEEEAIVVHKSRALLFLLCRMPLCFVCDIGAHPSIFPPPVHSIWSSTSAIKRTADPPTSFDAGGMLLCRTGYLLVWSWCVIGLPRGGAVTTAHGLDLVDRGRPQLSNGMA